MRCVCKGDFVVLGTHFFGSFGHGTFGAAEEELETAGEVCGGDEHYYKADHWGSISVLLDTYGWSIQKTPMIFPTSMPLIAGLSGSTTIFIRGIALRLLKCLMTDRKMV